MAEGWVVFLASFNRFKMQVVLAIFVACKAQRSLLVCCWTVS